MLVIKPAFFGFSHFFLPKSVFRLPPYLLMLRLMDCLEVALWPFPVPISAVDAASHLPIRSLSAAHRFFFLMFAFGFFGSWAFAFSGFFCFSGDCVLL